MLSVSKDKIGIVTTVSNFDLYNQARQFFPDDIKVFVVDGTKGFYGLKSMLFFIEKLKKFEIDYLIMADEDVIFKNPNYVFDLIDYMEENKYITCGMRDGGTLEWRNKNPFSINTFFSVLHLREIYSFYNRKEIKANQYIKIDEDLGSIDQVKVSNYDKSSLFEHYYCFYFWLIRKNKKILYLDATSPTKDETTLLYDHLGREFLYHAWYSRYYNIGKYHTHRINRLLQYGAFNKEVKEPILLKNHVFAVRQFLYKYYGKIKRKFFK